MHQSVAILGIRPLQVAISPSAPLIDSEFSFVADSLQLWSSVRESRGARYTTVASWKLG